MSRINIKEQTAASVPTPDTDFHRIFVDSSDGIAKKKDETGTVTALGSGDADAIHDNVAGEINIITEKVSPVGADEILIEDSAAGYVKKKVQISNLPAGGEINNLAGDGISGIADDQLAVGTGAGTAAYKTLPNGAVAYATATNAFSQAAVAGLSDGAQVVKTDQSNTFSTGTQNFVAATDVIFKDTALIVQDNADPTKQLRLDASAIGTGQTRTYTTPDANTQLLGATGPATVSNKTLDNSSVITIKDVNLTIQDDGDTTKQLKIQAGNITTGTTRTVSAPDADGTLVLHDNTQTLSGKDLTSTTNRLRVTKGLMLENPTASENKGGIFVNRAVTVTQVRAVLTGSVTSVTYQVKHGTDRSAAADNVTTSAAVTSTTTGTDATLSDATVPANSHIWVVTTAVSGTSGNFELFIEWTED